MEGQCAQDGPRRKKRISSPGYRLVGEILHLHHNYYPPDWDLDPHANTIWWSTRRSKAKWPIQQMSSLKQNLGAPPRASRMNGGAVIDSWMDGGAFIQIHPLKINMLRLTQTQRVWRISSPVYHWCCRWAPCISGHFNKTESCSNRNFNFKWSKLLIGKSYRPVFSRAFIYSFVKVLKCHSFTLFRALSVKKRANGVLQLQGVLCGPKYPLGHLLHENKEFLLENIA